MRGLGEGLAFCALVAGTVYLEIKDLPVTGLWILVVVWAVSTDWGQKNSEN